MLRGQIESIELAFMIINHPQSESEKGAIRIAAEHCVAHYRTQKGFVESNMDYFSGVVHGISAMLMGLPQIKVPEYLASRDRRDQQPGGDLEGLKLSPLKILHEEGVLNRLQALMAREMDAAMSEAGGIEGINRQLIERLKEAGIDPDDASALGNVLKQALQERRAEPKAQAHGLNDEDFLKSLGIGKAGIENPNLTEEPYEDDEEQSA